MFRSNFLSAFALLMLFGPVSQADCTSPAAKAGAREYNTTSNRFQLCTGTSWIDFSINGTMGACTGSGKLEWDTGSSVYKYCSVGTWQRAEKGACTVTAVTWLSKIAADTTALQSVSAAVISADGNTMYTGGTRIAKWTLSGGPPGVPSKTGHGALLASSATAQELEVLGNYVFAFADSGSLTVWDVSGATPTLAATRAPIPAEVGTGNGLELSADGTKAFTVTYLAGGSKGYFHVFDITNPLSTAAPIATLDVTIPAGVTPMNVVIKGNYAFLSFKNRGGTGLGGAGVPEYLESRRADDHLKR